MSLAAEPQFSCDLNRGARRPRQHLLGASDPASKDVGVGRNAYCDLELRGKMHLAEAGEPTEFVQTDGAA